MTFTYFFNTSLLCRMSWWDPAAVFFVCVFFIKEKKKYYRYSVTTDEGSLDLSFQTFFWNHSRHRYNQVTKLLTEETHL